MGRYDLSELELDASTLRGEEGSGLLLATVIGALSTVPPHHRREEALGLVHDIDAHVRLRLAHHVHFLDTPARDLRRLRVQAAQLCASMNSFNASSECRPARSHSPAWLASSGARTSARSRATSSSQSARALACHTSRASSTARAALTRRPQLEEVLIALDSRSSTQSWISRLMRHNTQLREHVASALAGSPAGSEPLRSADLRSLILSSIRPGSGRPDVPSATDNTAAVFRLLDGVLT